MAVAPAIERERRPPDPKALAVASKLQDRLSNAQVVLFGSRGRRGTWERHSDLDLAVIGMDTDRASVVEMTSLSKSLAKEVYEDRTPYVQIFPFGKAEYEELRVSLPHIAGQVQYWGLTPEGEPLPPMTQDNPWPGVRDYLQSSRVHMEGCIKALGRNDPRDAVGDAHRALETMLKAALGALQVQFEKTHALPELSNLLYNTRPEWLHGMLSETQQAELTLVRLVGDYAGESFPWPGDSPEDLVERVQFFCGHVAPMILEEMGKSFGDVGYTNVRGDTDFAGWDLVPLDAFSNESEIAAGEARGREEGLERGMAQGMEIGEERGIDIGRDIGMAQGMVQGREEGILEERTIAAIRLIPVLLDAFLPPAERQALSAHWEEHGAPADYLDLLQEVQANPDQWRRICDCPD